MRIQVDLQFTLEVSEIPEMHRNLLDVAEAAARALYPKAKGMIESGTKLKVSRMYGHSPVKKEARRGKNEGSEKRRSKE